MAQRENRVDVISEYIDLLKKELDVRFGINPTTKDILAHLIERGMIEPKRLRNYMVIKDFDELLVTNNIIK